MPVDEKDKKSWIVCMGQGKGHADIRDWKPHRMFLCQSRSILKLSRNIWRIKGMNPGPFMLDGTNTYLIGTGKRRLLIDTSNGNTEYTDLLSKSRRIANFDSIDTILLTHGHKDHSGVEPVKKLFPQVRIYKLFAGKPWIPIQQHSTFQGEGYVVSPVPTPGHTLDHCAYRLGNVLFSGDAVIGHGSVHFDNLNGFMNSLAWIQSQNFHTIYPGKGPIITDTWQHVQNQIDHRNHRTLQILSILQRRPSTLEELSMEIYDGYPPLLRKKGVDLIFLHLQELLRVRSVRQQGIFYTIK
jgi:glyoxylase-like metal-dependent hydrolase (beta-lactamase superfamily II)